MQPQDRTKGDALARPRLTKECQDLSRAQLEADRVDGANHAVPGRELDAEVTDAQE
jgi:hypothetical protein